MGCGYLLQGQKIENIEKNDKLDKKVEKLDKKCGKLDKSVENLIKSVENLIKSVIAMGQMKKETIYGNRYNKFKETSKYLENTR